MKEPLAHRLNPATTTAVISSDSLARFSIGFALPGRADGAVQLGVECTGRRRCERTEVTLNGDLLTKAIDEHNVAGRIASL